MKCVILAGGRGTRIAEESNTQPKPLVRIGDSPVILHIMKYYSSFGVNDFVICLGYKGYLIKEYFANYILHQSDVTIDFKENSVEYHDLRSEPWRVTLVDTGLDTMTGGRLKRIAPFVRDDPFFFLTYGDGVSDVDISAQKAFHQQHGLLATMTVTAPTGRFGTPTIDGDLVVNFEEKPAKGGLVNGGFFVMSPGIFDLIEGDSTSLEHEPLRSLAQNRQLAAWRHDGFWHPMDTVRDRDHLENLWVNGVAPWKVW
ncbi:MAG: glucose-1-phosphate cytidylyltransferase [Rhodospirillales bacterium]|nr:glucose-1-phosphate cytidylyltransferase [Rhodospirillales bacterium]